MKIRKERESMGKKNIEIKNGKSWLDSCNKLDKCHSIIKFIRHKIQVESWWWAKWIEKSIWEQFSKAFFLFFVGKNLKYCYLFWWQNFDNDFIVFLCEFRREILKNVNKKWICSISSHFNVISFHFISFDKNDSFTLISCSTHKILPFPFQRNSTHIKKIFSWKMKNLVLLDELPWAKNIQRNKKSKILLFAFESYCCSFLNTMHVKRCEWMQDFMNLYDFELTMNSSNEWENE